MTRRIRTSESVQVRARELRQEMTAAESLLWQQLRDRRLGGYKFRRQAPMQRTIADFYCPQVKLAIELDGGIHADQAQYDAERTRFLEDRGCVVIRFNNRDIEERLPAVLEQILLTCQRLESEIPA